MSFCHFIKSCLILFLPYMQLESGDLNHDVCDFFCVCVLILKVFPENKKEADSSVKPLCCMCIRS